MIIDEEKKHVLTNCKQVKTGGKAADSDHNVLYMDVNLKILTAKPVRRVVWNFKNKICQEKFKIETSNTNVFTDCFMNDWSIENQIRTWKNTLVTYCNKAFKKIRVTSSHNKLTEVDLLMEKRRRLKNKKGAKYELEFKCVEKKLVELCGKKNFGFPSNGAGLNNF